MSRPAILAGLAASALCGLIAAATAVAATQPATTATSADIAHRKYEQTRPQREVPFNPAEFDKTTPR